MRGAKSRNNRPATRTMPMRAQAEVGCRSCDDAIRRIPEALDAIDSWTVGESHVIARRSLIGGRKVRTPTGSMLANGEAWRRDG